MERRKSPTGGRGDYVVSISQITEFAKGGIPQQLENHINDKENPHVVTKEQVGLGNVDNTTDLEKPLSEAAQVALNLKADKATTLNGYGINDAYTKSETNSLSWYSDSILDGNQTQDQINLFGGKKYEMLVGGYPINAELVLDDGRKVKSLVDGNLVNPNNDLTGWVHTDSAQFVLDESGKTQQEINDRTVHIEDYGAVSGGFIDCTAAFNLAKVDAKSRGVPITARDDAEYLINGVCYFDCDLSGGVYLLGDSADMQLKVESDDVYNIRAAFKNVSGIDTKQALICISSDGVNKRGDVRIDCKFHGFLQGVYGRYLRRFHILPTSYAYSRNTVAGRTAESHFACVHTDLYIAQGESDGSVLGYSSGAGVVTDIYKCIARNSSDHGIYSSSPTNKRLTIFDNCITEDTSGSGQKCFSNGDVWMINPTAHRIGKVALLPVGNRVFIRGGSVKDSVLSAVYQIGKEVGAGVNTFDYLEVDGLNAVNVGDHFVRVAGAEYIGKVVLKNLTGDTERALLNIATSVNVPSVEIENCPVLCKPASEAVISVLNSTNPSQKISIKGDIKALTNSANLIDVNTLNLTLDASFDFISAPRLVRNRNASGVCNIVRAEINSGSTTSGLILADSGFFTNARNVPTVNNNLTLLHSTAAPTAGNFTKGSIAYNSNASVNGVLGWYCTASGSPGTWQSFGIIADANLRTQSTTTVNLNSTSNAINTANKYLGREVYNTTISKFMKATGSLATDNWVSLDGSTIITPV